MFKRNAAVLLIAGLVLGGGAYAWAQGAPERPTTTTAQSDQPNPERSGRARHGRKGGGAHLHHAIHGDLLVPNQARDGFENVTFDRGEVTAVSASSITVKRPDGQSVTKAIDANTKFRGANSASEVQTGKPAMVVSKGNTATQVAQPTGERRRPANEGQRPQGVS